MNDDPTVHLPAERLAAPRAAERPVTLLVQLVVRRRIVAAILTVQLLTPIASVAGNHLGVEFAINAVLITAGLLVQVRYGVIALTLLIAISTAMAGLPLTLDPNAWYFGRSLAMLLGCGALAAWGCWTAMPKQSLAGVMAVDEA